MRGPPLPADIDQKILEAADRLLARYGYRKMTIDDLAEEVGIGKGTIYLRFKSKDEIVLATVDRIVDAIIEEMEALAASRLSPAEKLRRMLVLRIMHRFDRVQHYTKSLSEVLRDLRAELLQRRESYFAREAVPLAAVLKQGQAAGAFRREPPLMTARTLLAATNSLLPFSLSARELGTRKEVKATAEKISSLITAGLTSPHRTPRSGKALKR